ncbi:MAG: DJ-1/PfpI family protein, partial [Bacteroides sp.]
MKTVYVFLANGFEEIEAITTIDVLRRAGLTVKSVSITKNKSVIGAHHITVEGDSCFEENSFDEAMQGCEIVLHMASPFVVTNFKDAVKDIIEPAVLGTENVL